jgi:hypothetical protein
MSSNGSSGHQSDTSASSEQETDNMIMEENSCDEVEERQMTSQDGKYFNTSSQDSQSQPSM